MSWIRLTLQVRTPLFCGDDPEVDGAPVRVPSIRGALRFWFRAVAAGHGMADLKHLWEAEQAVFGSTATPSAIGLRVPRQPAVTGRGSKPDWATTEQRGFDGAQYLLGQGLWDYGTGLSRGCVEPGAEFWLDIRFSRHDEVNARFLLALWAWLTYGGLGARTRRGFGQLVCTAVRGELPGGWTLAALAPPRTADGWHALGSDVYPSTLPGRAALGWGAPLPAPAPEDEPLPAIPTLAPRWWAGFVLDEPAGSLGRALHLAGLRWRQFRAADDEDRGDKPGPSTRSPEWRHVLHGADSRYPIAAFGLPVGYFSRSGGRTFKATVDPKLAGEALRRASPVWLRPVQVGPGAWDVFTHLFLAELLPPGATLQITGGTRRTLPPPADVEDAWNRWIDGAPRLPHDYYPRT